MLFVKSDLLGHIHIGNTITVSEAEGLILKHIARDSLQTTTGERFIARIHQGYTPWLSLFLVDFHLVTAHVKSDIRHV